MDQPRTPGRSLRAPSVKAFGLTGLTLLFLSTLLAGCSGSGKSNTVQGKVTLDGQPVSGVVTFIGPSKKKEAEKSSPINLADGMYSISDPELGVNTIIITGGLGGGGPGVGATRQPTGDMTKMTKDMMKDMTPQTGVAPPEKYANPATSGLSLEVKGGKQVHDLPLSK
jgi:hypothetical protein